MRQMLPECRRASCENAGLLRTTTVNWIYVKCVHGETFVTRLILHNTDSRALTCEHGLDEFLRLAPFSYFDCRLHTCNNNYTCLKLSANDISHPLQLIKFIVFPLDPTIIFIWRYIERIYKNINNIPTRVA